MAEDGMYLSAGKIDDLADGTMKEVVLNGRHVLLVRVAGDYYATDGRCPHMAGRLARGELEGTVVTCPRHGSRFDVTDGHVVRWLSGGGLLSRIGAALKSPRPLATYAIKVEGGEVLVDV
jgi:3-phenylpropionate/trans-cinnamate dioxygenase ferredoxin subunit